MEFREQRKREGCSMSSMKNDLNQNSGDGVGSEVTEGKDLPLGRIRAKLAGTVDVVVNGDYGEDHAALSKSH